MPIDTPTTFTVGGRGFCSRFKINFGDGASTEIMNTDFGQMGTAVATVSHTYTGWSGLKTVSVEGLGDCGGTAKQLVRVVHQTPTPHVGEVIGYTAGKNDACGPPLPFHSLRPNTSVNIDSPAEAVDNSIPTISFCIGGCRHDAAGIPNSVSSSNSPFPGLRELSLVLRVGSQVVQGGIRTNFRTTQSGPLEICVNDGILWDNTGAWRMFIQVDESQAP
jgi:hypothetical protein